MSKYCPIAKQNTNCTDNCASCMADEKRYAVKACICTNFVGVIATLETDDFYEVQDFIWENCQKGLNCHLTDKERDESNWVYAESFNEDTVDYADLHMEQQEQM